MTARIHSWFGGAVLGAALAGCAGGHLAESSAAPPPPIRILSRATIESLEFESTSPAQIIVSQEGDGSRWNLSYYGRQAGPHGPLSAPGLGFQVMQSGKFPEGVLAITDFAPGSRPEDWVEFDYVESMGSSAADTSDPPRPMEASSPNVAVAPIAAPPEVPVVHYAASAGTLTITRVGERTIDVTFDEITLRPADGSGEERVVNGVLRSELIWSCYVDAPADAEPPAPEASGGIQPLGPLLTTGGQMRDEKLETDFCRARVPAR